MASGKQIDKKKRDFITLTANAMLGVGALAAVSPLIVSMNPDADVMALSKIEVNLSSVLEGQTIKVRWRGKPIFIRRRTAKEVEEALNVDLSKLPDPELDSDRAPANKKEWIILVGICTHLGCIPIGESGDYDGWYCPCHGSHYDTSGRIRKGPAPSNMVIPPYDFRDDGLLVIG